jgi:hypothetical protein
MTKGMLSNGLLSLEYKDVICCLGFMCGVQLSERWLNLKLKSPYVQPFFKADLVENEFLKMVSLLIKKLLNFEIDIPFTLM